MKRLSWGWWGAGIALLAGMLASKKIGLPALTLLRIGGASAVVFVLPGLSLLRWSGRRIPFLEALPLAFGLSTAVMTFLTVVWVELGWPARGVEGALIAIIAAGFLCRRRRPGNEGETGDDRWPAFGRAGMVALASACVIYSLIGGTLEAAPTAEEVLHMTIIRKIWGNPILSTHNFMYLPDSPTTYLYAPYHAMVAVVARVSGLDPLVVFMRIRGVFTFMAVITMTGLVYLVTRRAALAAVGLWVFLGLLLSNVAGQTTAADGQYLYWAQLAPLSHLGDFSLGVILPLCLFFTIRSLCSRSLLSADLGLAALMAATATIIHVREGLQVLLYLGCFAVGTLVLRCDRKLVMKALLLGAVIVAVGLIYRVRHEAIVGHIGIHETATKRMVMRNLEKLLEKPVGGLLARTAYFREERLMFQPIPAVWLLAAPFLLVWFRQPWALFCGSILIGFPILFRVPWLATLYVKLTYSEVLVTPFRNIAHLTYLLTALAACGAVAWHDRLARQGIPGWFATFWLAMGGVGVWLGAGKGLSALATGWQDGLFLLWIAALAAALLLAWFRWRERRLPLSWDRWDAPVLSWRTAAALAVIIAAFWLIRTPPSLAAQLARIKGRVAVERWAKWYDSVPQNGVIPYEVLQLVTKNVPSGSVVLIDYGTQLQLPMMANVYVPTSGTGYSPDMGRFVEVLMQVRREHPDFGTDPWLAYQARSVYYRQVLAEAPPIFSPKYTDEQQLQFISLLKGDYLLYRSDVFTHLNRLTAGHPGLFTLVGTAMTFQLYRVTREKLPVSMGSR